MLPVLNLSKPGEAEWSLKVDRKGAWDVFSQREFEIFNLEYVDYVAELRRMLDDAWLGDRRDYADLYGETGRGLAEPGGEVAGGAPETAQPEPAYLEFE